VRQSVETKLASVRTEDFVVEIDASFVLDRSFGGEFLRFINKRKKGYFQGASNSDARLKHLISEVDWNTFDSVIGFIDQAIDRLKTHDGQTMSIGDQVTDVKDFYDYVFSLDYLAARYELRLGGKNLNELSPGEKGLLLLIFYLQLDMDNIPLVIDQPEDNLDNDSIFAVLARCIRNAKENRQVILVTHNPNLAVGADAEQIIFVRLEKAKNYKFSYETGAIENPTINQRIVDVLEGSQPAFVKRRLKYEIR
jgi:ATPase subunit of ABC transporter with duplicated ATPase domains